MFDEYIYYKKQFTRLDERLNFLNIFDIVAVVFSLTGIIFEGVAD